MNPFKEQFLLDPDVIFLNHGSYGATPRPVFEVYQDWQRRLERQPVKFLGREIKHHLSASRAALASYLNTSESDLIYVPNATFGVNVVARSLTLGPGDEVLTCDQEYGACNKTWQYLSRQKGFTYKQQPIPLPCTNSQEIIEAFWQGVGPQTKVIYLSHITSPTALILPVKAICERAKAAGIITVIDGAHAPGQLDLDLKDIGADFYTGNCHKWLCSPKGAGFLYAHEAVQKRIEPLIVSWGYEADASQSSGSPFLDTFEWLGTNDPAAYLAVPAAIAFQQEHHWPEVRQSCHGLLQDVLTNMEEATGLKGLYPPDSDLYGQLGVAVLPQDIDAETFKTKLYDDFCIEVPLPSYKAMPLMRISVQAYNTAEELNTLVSAVKQLLT